MDTDQCDMFCVLLCKPILSDSDTDIESKSECSVWTGRHGDSCCSSSQLSVWNRYWHDISTYHYTLFPPPSSFTVYKLHLWISVVRKKTRDVWKTKSVLLFILQFTPIISGHLNVRPQNNWLLTSREQELLIPMSFITWQDFHVTLRSCKRYDWTSMHGFFAYDIFVFD